MIKLIFCILFIFSAQQVFAQNIATFGNQSISKKEFQKSYKKALENGISLNRAPTKKEHLEDMIRYKIGLLEAKNTNLKSNPKVKDALELELYKGLLEVNLAKDVDKIRVTEKQMKAYYKNNPFMRSSHIFIRLPKNPNAKQVAEAQKRANKIYQNLSKSKKPWTVQVRNATDDTQTKTIGGDLGYHGSSTLHPVYYGTLKKMTVNQISPPIRGLFGFHIIKKTGQLSYERADKNAIQLAVFNEKRFDVYDRYFGKLKSKYKVFTNKDLL